jgi:diguanylate cyclase (GGDEF)-like protein/PAS domain S-box-containing protein
MDGFNQKISKLFGYSAVEINQQRVMRKRLETDVPELMSYLDDLFLPSNSPEVLFLKYTSTDTIALAKKFISDKDQLKNFIKIIEQAHGMNFREFVSSETEKKLLNTFNELWTKGDIENSAGSSEWQIITKAGRKIYVEANLALMFDPNTGEKIGFRGALNDVTETKMRERKIKNMIGNMQDVIVEFDNKLQIVDIMNPHMLAKLTGYSIKEITRIPYKNFVEKDSFIKIKELYSDFKKRKFPAESTSIRVCLHKKNAKEDVWGDININPIYDEENNHVGYFAVARDVTEDVEKTRKLETMATIDGLTKVYNRDTFVALAEQQLATASREKSKLLIGFFDIDKFKQINDVYGHSEGDRALMNTAQIISANLRDCDIVGRFGGDEFIVLFQKADLTHEEIIKNKIKTGLEIFNKNNPYNLCISMGFVEYDPAKSLTLQDLLLSADEKMYKDKENKKVKK